MIFGSVDIGTNSVRLAVVDLHPDGTWTTVASQKEVVRLGDGEFVGGHARLTSAAMHRAVRVLSRFADVAKGYGADDVVTLATAASREAENQEEFVEAVNKESGGFLDVRVISGHEEARLIYLGIRSGIDMNRREKALFLDIGGGSSELVIADSRTHHYLDSLKLGAIRLTSEFLSGKAGTISPGVWSKLCAKVRSTLAPASREIASRGFTRMYGSSGTIMSLAEIAARRSRPDGDAPPTMRNYELTLPDLVSINQMLCRMTLEERRKVPGLTPERADIVIGGAAILQTVMETVGAGGILISDRGLREGIVVDYFIRQLPQPVDVAVEPESVRVRSVRALARRCKVDEAHSRHIRDLALSLFDQTFAMGLHELTSSRELLDYASYLHDSGFFVSHTNHHQHSYYLIRNSELLGFNDIEIELMAQIAYYHRKSPPRKRHTRFARLTEKQQSAVRVLSCCLRLAEALDRGHLASITGVRLQQKRHGEPVTMVIESHPDVDISLEVWAVEGQAEVFGRAYGVPMEIQRPPTAGVKA
ncbi:MAG: Ppx/GppA phosphatase family protein [Capsulimonadaceae bacterium]|nr:Ppx/GppA phosphatase family protein [Capsulimonadaceae bacterium]